MCNRQTRRQFMARTTAAAAGATFGAAISPLECLARDGQEPMAKVAIARDDRLLRSDLNAHCPLLQRMLDASIQKLVGVAEAESAWRTLVSPRNRVGIKVNTLGHSTSPAVVDAIVAGLRSADVPAENIVIWDRFDVELLKAGYKLNKSASGVRCYGTDADQGSRGAGYQRNVEVSGEIGSCFSRIAAETVDTLICVPVLKDHNLAGASLGMKNFFGAIHNPNKYHGNNCDPYVADVASHRFIRPKWRLTICDAIHAQYNGGPAHHPGFDWPFAGLISSTDFVACDAVAADLLDKQRKTKGLSLLKNDGRPFRHIETAAQRGLGIADLSRIKRMEV